MNRYEIPKSPYTFLALNPAVHNYEQSGVVVLPVPYDGTASFKSGARDGPEAIISASRELEDYDMELGIQPSEIGIYTSAALEPHMGTPSQMVKRVSAAVSQIAHDGKIIAMLGGDHSISVGAVKALLPIYPDLSVLYLDAHADFRDSYLGTKWGHASTARRISELCSVIIAGIRSMSLEESKSITQLKIDAFTIQKTTDIKSLDKLIHSLSDHVYISVDLDVLDPSIMPAVGTPEPGGLIWDQLIDILRKVSEKKLLVGFDAVELAPKEGSVSCAYIAAKLIYKLIGFSLNPSNK